MSRRVGIFGRIYQNLKNSISAPQLQTTLVGTDHAGNKYFEKEADKSKNLRGARWVETPDGDQWNVPDIPTEWNAWLRGRRTEPPTLQELERNYAVMMRTIQRAKDLEEKEKLEMSPELKDGSPDYTSNVEHDDDKKKSQFPIYPDFEVQPGKKLK